MVSVSDRVRACSANACVTLTGLSSPVMRSGSRMKKEQTRGSVVEVDVANVPQAGGAYTPTSVEAGGSADDIEAGVLAVDSAKIVEVVAVEAGGGDDIGAGVLVVGSTKVVEAVAVHPLHPR